MKKYILTFSILILFVIFMISGVFLKNKKFNNINIPMQMNYLIEFIETENWNEAEAEFYTLERNWNKIIELIQFSCERDEIYSFTVNLAKLEQSIKSKDKLSCLLELAEAKQYWVFLGV